MGLRSWVLGLAIKTQGPRPFYQWFALFRRYWMGGLPSWTCRPIGQAAAAVAESGNIRPAIAADLDNMFNKLMLSALGLMAAVTGPMVFFAVSDYWKTGRVAAVPAVSALPAAASASAPLPVPCRHARHRLEDVFQFNITPDWICGAGRRSPPGWGSCTCRATGCRWSAARRRATWPAR